MDCLGQQSGVQSVQNLENVINEGLRAALLAETPDQSLDVLLQHLGMALDGERTYIFVQMLLRQQPGPGLRMPGKTVVGCPGGIMLVIFNFLRHISRPNVCISHFP